MKHRRGMAAVAGALLISMLFTGCWDGDELTEIIPVIGVGLDSAGNGLTKMTIQVGEAGESASKEDKDKSDSRFAVYENTGKNIFSMERDITHESSHKLFWGHNQCIILGKKQAQQGVKAQLDFFMRDHQPRLDVWMLVAEGTANEILKTKLEMSPLSGIDITQLLKNQGSNSESVHTDLLEFATKMQSETTCPVASIIRVDNSGEKPRLDISGLAIFKKDKLVAELGQRETRGFLWAVNRVQSGTVNVRTAKGTAALEIRESCGSLKPHIEEDGSVSLTISISAELGIREMAGFEQELPLLATTQIQEAAVQEIRDCVLSAFQKTQQYKTDIYGIGRLLDERQPREWKSIKKNWEALYPRMKPKVEINVNVQDRGAIIKLKG